jgi:hypothetical protein
MLPIPDFISNQLRDHLLSECPFAQAGWEFANQDEDTLTGDFFGRLRTNWQTSEDYEWRFHYNKVRGRGKSALEKKIGADGIITLHYRNPKTLDDYYKSLIFQAKKENSPINNLQWSKMKRFFPNGNMVVVYGSNGYYSYVENTNNRTDLCLLIANNFLNCTIGIEGLYYDHDSNKFIRPTNIPLSGTVENELMIEVFKNP